MNQPANWIDEYFEWTAPATPSLKSARPPHVAQNECETDSQSAAAYLEWTDIVRGSAAESPPGERRGALREKILLTALKAESDCVYLLRQALDARRSNPRTIKLASQALKHAKRLLDEERGAWHALRAMHSPADRITEASWPRTLEAVAADVHALSDKVLALQARRHH